MTNQSQQHANAYLRTRVMSASPEELRMLLLEGALRFARQGREGLEANDPEKSYEGFSQARNIIVELMSSMRPEVSPELCERVRSLYTFIYSELVSASFERDLKRADNAIELLVYECETWRQLMDKLEQEHASGEAPAQATSPAQPEQDRPSLSLRG